MPMPGPFHARHFLMELTRARNEKDADSILRRYADDAEMHDPSLARPVRGKAALRQHFDHWASAFSELEFQLRDSVQSGNKQVLITEAKARHTGDLQITEGEWVAPTGKLVSLEMAHYIAVGSDGRILIDHVYFDMASLRKQLADVAAHSTQVQTSNEVHSSAPSAARANALTARR